VLLLTKILVLRFTQEVVTDTGEKMTTESSLLNIEGSSIGKKVVSKNKMMISPEEHLSNDLIPELLVDVCIIFFLTILIFLFFICLTVFY
jgi:hypothetical protein